MKLDCKILFFIYTNLKSIEEKDVIVSSNISKDG